jgi:hypothetical protein
LAGAPGRPAALGAREGALEGRDAPPAAEGAEGAASYMASTFCCGIEGGGGAAIGAGAAIASPAGAACGAPIAITGASAGAGEAPHAVTS